MQLQHGINIVSISFCSNEIYVIIVLKEWFTAVCSEIIFPFKTIEYVEMNSLDNSAVEFFSNLLQENTVDEEFLKDMQKKHSGIGKKFMPFLL